MGSIIFLHQWLSFKVTNTCYTIESRNTTVFFFLAHKHDFILDVHVVSSNKYYFDISALHWVCMNKKQTHLLKASIADVLIHQGIPTTVEDKLGK